MAEYPEHEKMSAVIEDSQRLGAFIDWMQGRGYMIAEWVDGEYRNSDQQLAPVHKSINEWLALFYEIDLTKIEEEKRAMLDEIRAANARA